MLNTDEKQIRVVFALTGCEKQSGVYVDARPKRSTQHGGTQRSPFWPTRTGRLTHGGQERIHLSAGVSLCLVAHNATRSLRQMYPWHRRGDSYTSVTPTRAHSVTVSRLWLPIVRRAAPLDWLRRLWTWAQLRHCSTSAELKLCRQTQTLGAVLLSACPPICRYNGTTWATVCQKALKNRPAPSITLHPIEYEYVT